MTICGASAFASDQAIIWADSVVSRGGVRVRHMDKIAISVATGIAATGTGNSARLDEADRVVRAASSLHEALRLLPELLRRPRPYNGAYAVVGYDFRSGRVLVYAMQPPGFWPEPSTLFMAPLIEARRPETALAALDIAAAQLALSRASGGALSVAELGPGGFLCRVLFDLDRSEFIDGPVGAMD